MKTSATYYLIIGCALVFASGMAPAFGGVFSRDASMPQRTKPHDSTAKSCLSAEECFATAVFSKERLGPSFTKDQATALKLERLRKVIKEYPVSQWGKRAVLL
ncbi:MAG: hypothetical protein CV090_10190, partial [Nitrospira sp. WS238]|nr:hypothetical protein [Nitrospira sp. WS238]